MSESEQADFKLVKGGRGNDGERAPHGDHGQDGRQGPQGEPGVDGTAGATGRRGAHLKGTDMRLIFLYAFVLIALTAMYFMLGHQQGQLVKTQTQLRDAQVQLRTAQNQLIANCNKGNAAAKTFNAALDQLIANSKNTTGLTAAQKKAALQRYSKLHQPLAECPPKQ